MKKGTYSNTPERFWSRVSIGAGCWSWMGGRDRAGYGKTTFKKQYRASHRLAWEIVNGPIAPGLFVCHRCDNPGCVRPDHLFLGTASDNMADRNRKGRQWSGAKGERKRVNGSRGGACILTPEKVVEARQRYAAGESQQRIAADMGVASQTISAAVTGANWKHIEHQEVA